MLVSVEQYFEGGTSICRNATIQKIFGFIGGGERAGSGADTIAKGWEFNHWPKPRIREKYDPDRVELTLMIGGKNQVSTTPKTSPKTNPKTSLKNGKATREEIIKIIKRNPTVSASEIAVSCKLTKAGIKYHLAILREQGILSHSPEKKGGYWIVNEKDSKKHS